MKNKKKGTVWIKKIFLLHIASILARPMPENYHGLYWLLRPRMSCVGCNHKLGTLKNAGIQIETITQ